ncbi:restriction endonuclease subunit S [Flavobacterium adhaerens]|uniref:restriction endonuclease subunit S n=1 Tax=Flavobacterium adhaerens TaxID=3149043 RepID=UPI0032B6055C
MENKKVKIKDVVKLINGYPFKPTDRGSLGMNIIRIQNLNNPLAIYNKTTKDVDKKFIVKKGDILISWSASLGVYEWKNDNAYLNQHIFKVEFISDKISKDYFRYVIQLAIEELTYKMRGVGLKHLTKGQLDTYEFILPNIAEQTIIINRLNNLESLILKRTKSIKLLNEYIKSTFLEMFGSLIVSNKKTNFKVLTQLAQNKKNAIKAGPFGSELKKEYYVSEGYKVYGQEQVINNDFSFGNYYIDKERFKKLNSCKIEAGDVLISLVGTLGKVAIVPDLFEDGVINPRLIKISFDRKIINPYYIKSLFETSHFEALFKDISKGGAVKSLNLSVLKKINIPVPEINLQNKYSDQLKLVEKQVQKFLKSQLLFEEMFQSLLYNSFNLNKIEEDEIDKLINDELEIEKIIQDIKASDFESLTQYNSSKELLFKILERTEIKNQIEKESSTFNKGVVQIYSQNKIEIKTNREHKLDSNETSKI